MFGDGKDAAKLYFYVKSQLANNKEVLLSDGKQVRDFIEVKKAAEQIAMLSMSQETGVQNICSGEGVTIRDFVLNIAKKSGKSHLLKFGSLPRARFDPDYIVGVKSNITRTIDIS